MRRSVVTHHRRIKIYHSTTGVIWMDRPVVRGPPADRLVQLSGIPFRPVAPNIGHPLALASQAVLRDKIGNVLQ
jgi:hypothetical protein